MKIIRGRPVSLLRNTREEERDERDEKEHFRLYGMTGDDNPLVSSWRFLSQDLGLFSSERAGARSRIRSLRDDMG